MILTVVLSALGGILIGAATFFGIKWVNSGNVKHSPAEVLFDAGEKFRQEQRQEILDLREEVSRLGGVVTGLREEVFTLKAEKSQAKAEINQLRTELAVFKMESAVLQKKVEQHTGLISSVDQEVRILQHDSSTS